MKKSFVIVIIVFISGFVFSQTGSTEYNYAGGNGTILSQTTENEEKILIRKHEQQLYVSPTSMYGKGELNVYEKPNINTNRLFVLKDQDCVNTLELAFIENTSTSKKSGWIKIRTDDNKIGWIESSAHDIYSDGNWSITEILTVNNRNWTVRKSSGGLVVWEVLNVRDNPGINGTKVLFKLIPAKDDTEILSFMAMTEERDTIDNITDHWVKIIDSQKRIGWMFGGYGDVNRGGPKYLNHPEAYIGFHFWPP